MQGWPLDRKIQVSQTRILEFGLKFDKQIYVSFSGGKDSTVLLDLVRRVFPDTPAVFIDTGLEYPEIRDFVRGIDNVTWLKPRMNFRKVIETYGYPLISKESALYIYYARKAKERGDLRQYEYYVDGKRVSPKTGEQYTFAKLCKQARMILDSDIQVSNRCCEVMKKTPMHEYQRKTGRHPIVGVMAEESLMRRNAWLKTGCNTFKGKEPKSSPMSFWTEQDVLAYIKSYNLPHASVYGEILQDENGKYYTTGCRRTGCVFCGFGCHLEKEPNRFQRLKVTHPKVWEFCMKPWDKGGLGMREVLEYIGVKTE